MKLQEAADELTANDVRTRLSDALSDHYRGTGNYGWLIDYIGDGESGDVIFCCNSDTFRATYEISGGNGTAAKCVIDFESAIDVVPRTVYEPEADEADHLAAMEEAFKRDELYLSLPLYERFISKAERDKADPEDFAGKGKSYPILAPGDIEAAVRSIGRAGTKNLGPSGIKARIIAIAKRKGWTKYLPKAWQEEKTSEAAPPPAAPAPQDLKLTEGAGFLGAIAVAEAARANYPVKLISPGTGTTAHYPAAVLERDGPKVFKAGTLMFWNHPTAKEEQERPEGNLDNLAAILTSDARYESAGPKGPGLYAEAKVMADYAQKVEERAPHIGLSIRAGGKGSGRLVDGKPELASIDYAESVDYVTKAGRGGLALAEAARYAGLLPNEKEGIADMDAAEVQKLVEAGIKAGLAPLVAETTSLRERALKGDAQVEATRIFADEKLFEGAPAARQKVTDNLLGRTLPKTDAGELDKAKFREALIAEAKDLGRFLGEIGAPGTGRVVGMGAAPVSIEEGKRIQEAKEASEKEREQIVKESAKTYTRILGNPKAGEAAARKGLVA